MAPNKFTHKLLHKLRATSPSEPPKRVIDGRPTDVHPWKRHTLLTSA